MSPLSMTNLAWPPTSVDEIAPRIRQAGLDGVEIAPTVIWSHAPDVPSNQVRQYAHRWREFDLLISGIQSLLYGRPDLQIFDRSTWPEMRGHLTSMIRLAHDLDTHIAVFGSPRNRVRGELSKAEANVMCGEFLTGLVPVLSDCGVVLTIEPNAPAYGADYLTHYEDAVALCDLINSPWVQPQVDSGCLLMVQEDPTQAVLTYIPVHIHISTPNLQPPPGSVDHNSLREALQSSAYDGWIVLEMLQNTDNPMQIAVESAQWLSDTYGSNSQDHAKH